MTFSRYECTGRAKSGPTMNTVLARPAGVISRTPRTVAAFHPSVPMLSASAPFSGAHSRRRVVRLGFGHHALQSS